MLLRLIFAVAIIFLLFMVIRHFKKSPPQLSSNILKQAAIYAAVAGVVILVVTGRLHWLFAAAASLIPLFKKALPLLRYAPFLKQLLQRFSSTYTKQQSKSEQTAQIESRYIRLFLNQNTGEINGLVLNGNYQGKNLKQLPLKQLLQLLSEYQQLDVESARLLLVFIDKFHGENWRNQTEYNHSQTNPPPSNQSTMTDEEAYQILGLSQPASESEIASAYKKLMLKMHPDRGGSSYLASKINQARDHLIKNN